jgi:3'-5' exonuclease
VFALPALSAGFKVRPDPAKERKQTPSLVVSRLHERRPNNWSKAMSNLFLDIETIPTDRADVRDYLAATVSAPAQMKKAETIKAWEENDKPAAVAEAVAKTGLDGAFGRVCVIGWAWNDEPARTMYGEKDEAALLLSFSDHLHAAPSDRFTTTVVGHNAAGFDLRFLVQRYIVNGIRPPMAIARAAQAKPWESEKVFDTMVQWAGVGGRISLDKLCLALSIPSPKGELDGSKVAEYVAAGRIEEVADYCEKDVEAARSVWRRMTFQTVQQFEDIAA